LFGKFDFSFEDIMVAKKKGAAIPGQKRTHKEMVMSSTTTSVVKGQLVGKR
jgi:hypothetical protein